MIMSSSLSSSTSSSSSSVPAELKLYQAFIFSVPILFAFILLFMFYLLYLRRQRADWSSVRMRTSPGLDSDISMAMAELGLKKEVREMLPIVIYKETFSIRDTQCSVCLGDYQEEDKLQQIPACGHTFHMDCLDHWLANHATCPLCRLSIVASPKAPDKLPITRAVNNNGSAVQPVSQSFGETQDVRPLVRTIGDARISEHNSNERDCVDQREFRDTRDETSEHGGCIGISA